MKNLIYGAIAIFVLYMWLSPKKVDLVIDNPTSEAITVAVDELNVEIPPKEVVWVEMGKGEHTVTLEDGSQHPYDYSGKAYFLNPTKSEYLLENHFYGDMSAYVKYKMAYPDKKVEYMGMELEGGYDVVKDLITNVTWDVGARESMPESVESDSSSDYLVMKKLIGPSEFIGMMMESFKAKAAEAKAEAEAN